MANDGKQNDVWVFDSSHTTAEFSARHMMISRVKGLFQKTEGKIYGTPDDWENAKAEVEIDVSSIYTRDEQRDGHLKSPDFFDAENHPTIRFETTGIKANGDDDYVVKGNLTIRGVTKEIELKGQFEGKVDKDPWGFERVGFSVEGKVNRQDFGLKWNTILETGGVMVGDMINISVHVEATKQAS